MIKFIQIIYNADTYLTWEICSRKEISAIRKNAFLDAVAMAFESYAPRVCIFVTVVTYALLGNAITAEKVFMISAFYNDMRYSLSIAFPLGKSRI